MKRNNTKTVLTLIVVPLLTFGLAAMGLVSPLRAEGPQTIGFQGFLTNIGGTPLNASPSIEFCLYTVVSGGSSVWCETQAVTVTDGIFSVRLGSVNPLTAIPFDEQYYLGTNVAGDGEMSPRQSLEAGPYALRSKADDSTTTVNVNCDTGGSINDALEAGARIINISGTCDEAVTIESDDVQLIGISSATIAPTASKPHGIYVNGAVRVVIKNMTVTGKGILADAGAAVTIVDSHITDTGGTGILVIGSSVMTVVDSTILRNGFAGIQASGNSTLGTRGNTIADNDSFGVLIFDSSMWHQGGPLPEDRDVIVQEGCVDDDPSPTTCGVADTHAIAVNSVSRADFSNLDATGRIAIGKMSLMSAKDSEIDGDIIIHRHSGADLDTGLSGDGTLNCDLSTGAFSIGTIPCGGTWP